MPVPLETIAGCSGLAPAGGHRGQGRDAQGTRGVLTGTPLILSSVTDNGNESIGAHHRNRLDRSRRVAQVEAMGGRNKRWSSRVLHGIGTVSEHAAEGLIATDDRLIALEGASDDELGTLTDLSQAHRERALGTDA